MLDICNKLFFDDLAAMSTRQRIEFCAKAAQKYAELGLVFAADAEVVPETLNMYQDTLAAGQLKIRIYTMNYNLTADALTESQIKTGFGSSRLRIGPIKIPKPYWAPCRFPTQVKSEKRSYWKGISRARSTRRQVAAFTHAVLMLKSFLSLTA